VSLGLAARTLSIYIFSHSRTRHLLHAHVLELRAHQDLWHWRTKHWTTCLICGSFCEERERITSRTIVDQWGVATQMALKEIYSKYPSVADAAR
jgi:hypothetical protein